MGFAHTATPVHQGLIVLCHYMQDSKGLKLLREQQHHGHVNYHRIASQRQLACSSRKLVGVRHTCRIGTTP